MGEFVDVVIYRDDPDPWNGLFVEDEKGTIVSVGTWLDTDDENKRVLRIQADEIEKI